MASNQNDKSPNQSGGNDDFNNFLQRISQDKETATERSRRIEAEENTTPADAGHRMLKSKAAKNPLSVKGILTILGGLLLIAGPIAAKVLRAIARSERSASSQSAPYSTVNSQGR